MEYSRHNIQWNGTSFFFHVLQDYGAKEIHNLHDIEYVENSLLMIIAPNSNFSDESIRAYKNFVKNGNTLFIACEAENANQLLKGIGSNLHILSGNLVSVDIEFNDPGSVIAFTLNENDTLLNNISTIILNKPSAVIGGTPLVNTSILSWMDMNSDFVADVDEPLKEYSIVSKEYVGGGVIYVLSDPSIFINSMQNIGVDNTYFIENIIAKSQYILVDQVYSKTADTTGVSHIIHTIKNSPHYRMFVIIITIFIMLSLFYLSKKL